MPPPDADCPTSARSAPGHGGATFTSPTEFAATTAAFTEQAVRAAAQVMIFPADPHRHDLAGLRERLREHSPAIAAASARRQVQVVDSRQVQDLNRVRAETDTRNAASARDLEKLGLVGVRLIRREWRPSSEPTPAR